MRRVLRWHCALVAAATLVFAGVPQAAAIVVNTPDDEDGVNSFCSLREAIMAANLDAPYHGCATGVGSNDLIAFNLGSGTPTILIGNTSLPPINESVTIDGGPGRVELRGPGGAPASGRHGLTVNSGGFGTIIRNLVINDFNDDGIFINADEVSVLGCRIGTDALGMSAIPNRGFGIQVFGGNGTRIGGATAGGPCTGDCNVIAGATATKANILLDINSIGAQVRGNFIGTNALGTGRIVPNNAPGIIDKGSSNRIGGATGTTPGGACTGDCNLISGNEVNGGIYVQQGAVGTIIQGNFIGTDVTGTLGVGNGRIEDMANSLGIVSYTASTVMIGGASAAARNVVGASWNAAILIANGAATVQGNYIGTNSAGTATLGGGDNIHLFRADGTTIGGLTAGAGNLVSGAIGYGIRLTQTNNALIAGNLIGTAADGMTPLENLSSGIYIEDRSSNNMVGGTEAGAGNVIAFNFLQGVTVGGAAGPVVGNAIRGNSIHSNQGLGIALLEGGNGGRTPPMITGVAPLRGRACAPCTVEIFSDDEDEGRVFEGSVFTSDGNWTFEGPLSGPYVTATNTTMSNNTSPFSAAVSLAPPSPSPSASPMPSPTATQTTPPTPDCPGDCDGNHGVTIEELITLVDIFSDSVPPSMCSDGLPDGGPGAIEITFILQAVIGAMGGCDVI